MSFPRSKDWVCSHCNRSNLDCLPDPVQPNDSSSSGSESEVKTPSEVEAPAEVMPPRRTQSEAPVSAREANRGGAEGDIRLESDDTTSVVASSHSSASGASTPSPDIHGTRQAGPASFRPSHTVRPPMLLDTAICVLLVLVFALLCRRVL
jgi:ubiquitin-conjugating enzyme E2 J1